MTSNWSRQHRTVVVDFSRGAIKIALAESACEAVRFRGITRIETARGAPTDSSEPQSELDSEIVVGCIRREVQRRGWHGLPAACLLPGSATSTQSFLLPPMPDEDLRRAIALRMSETLHFDLEDAYFDHRRLIDERANSVASALTLVTAARIDAIRQGVSALRQAGLRPVAIGAAAESLANLSQCTSLWNSEEASIHVDIGTDSAILNLFEGNLLRFSREIDVAGGTFTSALMRPILTASGPVHLTHEQAEQVQTIAGYPLEDEDAVLPHGIRAVEIVPLMEPVAQRLSAEIGRSIDYLCGLLGRPQVDRVVLSGSAGKMRNLDRFLQESLNTPVVCCDAVSRAMAHWRLAVCDDHPPDLADFSTILGYSLGNRQPTNLLPREEKLGHLVERISRVRKMFVPPLAAAGICIALVGVPITNTYQSAGEEFQRTSDQVDESLRQKAIVATERYRARESIQRVRSARGLVPDWVGIMKELSASLSEEVQLTSLEADVSEGIARLSLTAWIHPGDSPFGSLSTQLSLALSKSPYFTDVHVIEAAIADDEPHGRFEATLEIVAGGAAPR